MIKRNLIYVLIFSIFVSHTEAFFRGLSKGYICMGNKNAIGRRCIISVLGGALWTQPAFAEVIQVKRCDSGEGEGCNSIDPADPAAELIMSLRKKSAEKSADRVAEELRRYNENNFSDFFKVTGKVLVKHSDGTVAAVSEGELRKLMNQGIIRFDAAGYFFDEPAAPPAIATAQTLQ